VTIVVQIVWNSLWTVSKSLQLEELIQLRKRVATIQNNDSDDSSEENYVDDCSGNSSSNQPSSSCLDLNNTTTMHKRCVCHILLSSKEEWQQLMQEERARDHKIHTKEKCLVSDITYNDVEKVFSDSLLSSFGELLVVFMILIIVILHNMMYYLHIISKIRLLLIFDYC